MFRPHASSRYSPTNLCLFNLWLGTDVDDRQLLCLSLVYRAVRKTQITRCTPSHTGDAVALYPPVCTEHSVNTRHERNKRVRFPQVLDSQVVPVKQAFFIEQPDG